MVNTAIAKARAIPRVKALEYVVKSSVIKRPVFVVSWDPRLPSIDAIQRKHWRAMINLDPYLKEAFPEPPLLAYKRQKNIKDLVIKSKVPKINLSKSKRNQNGMKKCLKCPFSIT